jgi:hypothetical protein
MLFASDCTKEMTETQHTALLSLGRQGRGGTKHWDFPLFISLLSLSYISSFLSVMHKQIFYAWTSNEPWSARQDLSTILHSLPSQLSHSRPEHETEHQHNGFLEKICEISRNKITMCSQKPRHSVSKSKTRQQPNPKDLRASSLRT